MTPLCQCDCTGDGIVSVHAGVAVTGKNKHYSTVCGQIQLVISLECLIEITPDFQSPD